MSTKKNKNKQKKSQVHIELQKRYEAILFELLQMQIQVKSLSDQNAILAKANNQWLTENNELKMYIKQECQKLNLGLDSFKVRVTDLTSSKNQLQIQLATCKAKLQFERKEHEDWRREKERELDDCRRHYVGELGRYQNQSVEYSVAIAERQTILNERSNLNKMLSEERQEYRRQLSDKDRDKMQALDNLKKQMIDKFRDMKTSLLAIRREQLDNNTRLTLLQNHQLAQELQIQSTSTQKMIRRNVQLQRKIKHLQNQMGVHEQVEKQITKRAVFSKKLLKNYYQKNIGLQKEKGELSEIKNKEENGIEQIQVLRNKIIGLEDALNKTHIKIQALEKDNCLKQTQLNEFKKRDQSLQKDCTQVANILCRFYNELVSGQVQDASQTPLLDFKTLKMQNVSEWKLGEVQIVTKCLLNHIKPHLKASIFGMDAWRRIMQDRLPLPNTDHTANRQERKTNKCNTQYINSISLQKNKVYYTNKRKLQDVKDHRSLTKLPHEHSISFGRYVQASIRQWGPGLKKRCSDIEKIPNQTYSLVERFMRPLKTKLR